MKRGLLSAAATRLRLTAVCLLAAACGNPTGPSEASYAGQWTGSTGQGRPISFTISSDQAVTSITISHAFNGCAGSQTFESLAISIVPRVECIPGPCAPAIQSYRAFGYSAGNRVEGPSTDLNAVFMSTMSAQGTVNFRSYAGCGDAIGVPWSALRRQ